ncbi:MAG: carbohydrate ABC transporter permease [Alphaproteobacteria bacterium]|nr:carbohydrate ABC transporter permease [Alphaproteobacteria bacterium]
MVLTSLKPQSEVTQTPITYLPAAPTLEHYAELFQRTSFGGNLVNSLIVACGAVALALALSVPAAYAFSRFRFAGRKVLLVQFLVINMFPIVLLIIPLFVLMRQLGLLDTYVALIAGHGTFTIPFAVWMMTSYMNGIPAELDEAAMIDGCSRLQTIRRVVLPLAAPGIVTTAIYVFVTSWNEYLFAMMLSGNTVRTVTVALQSFIGEFTIQWGLLTAGGTLVALPVTILFLLVQRRLVGGLTAGAVKT